MCICIPNMRFLCLTLWQGEMLTDNDNTNANDDRQSMIEKAFWLINQMSQKTRYQVHKIHSWATLITDIHEEGRNCCAT